VKLQFIYKGYEVFSFNGDDDVWVRTSRSPGTPGNISTQSAPGIFDGGSKHKVIDGMLAIGGRDGECHAAAHRWVLCCTASQVFIDGTLAIDLSGMHPAKSAVVNLNVTTKPSSLVPWTKSLTVGQAYSMVWL
jgi:hypothetical protein